MSAAARSIAVSDLEGHEFLRGLGARFLGEIAPHTERREFPTGHTIAREGDPAWEFFLIEVGKVGLEIASHDRPRLTVLTLGPGEVFGWSWLVAPHRWRVDARTLKPTRVLVVEGSQLRHALESHPADGYHFLLRIVPILAQRLDATQLQVFDVYRP
jgi:CRP/FNR family transcriptional regulator, cyclic AMP receptor protein